MIPIDPPPYPETEGVPHVKICGLRRFEDAKLALDLGAAFLGIILTTKSKRHLSLEDARSLVRSVRTSHGNDVRFVGVYVDESPAEIAAAAEELKLFAVQVHKDTAEVSKLLGHGRIVPAMGIANEDDAMRLRDLNVAYPTVLADAHSPDAAGGTGRLFNHRLVQPIFPMRRVFLAGGLGPANIRDVVLQLGNGSMPYAFDLSSGVEDAPGIKSAQKLRDFFSDYREALAERARL